MPGLPQWIWQSRFPLILAENKQVKPDGRSLSRPREEFVLDGRRVQGSRGGRAARGAWIWAEDAQSKTGETGERVSPFLFKAETRQLGM